MYHNVIFVFLKNVLLLFVLHIGLTTLTSTMKMTAAIMIAARVARGMKLKYGVRNSKAKITSIPENERISKYRSRTKTKIRSEYDSFSAQTIHETENSIRYLFFDNYITKTQNMIENNL